MTRASSLLLSICCVLAAAAAAMADQHSYYTCYLSAGSPTVAAGKDPAKGVAWGYFDDTIEHRGYGVLSIATTPSATDVDQLVCAGYLEGYLTATRIAQLWYNFWHSTFNATNSQRVVEFTQQTMLWTIQQVRLNKQADPYWNHVGLVMTQLQALVNGYNQNCGDGNQLTTWQIFLMNMMGDLDDLIPALRRREQIANGENPPEMATSEEDVMNIIVNSHCSAIIKPTSDFSDLFSAHEMWSGYYQMLQIYKSYSFRLNATSTASQKVSFSSYPAFLSSEDDFYVLDTKLVVMETTNGVFNLSIYDAIKPQSLMSWIRAIVANRMADSGQEWVNIMAKYNSGTYNNQWMVTDLKLFEKGQSKLAPNTLWIGSQMPGYFETADVTSVINSQGYWASYNIPYFKDIFAMAGYPAMVEKYGNLWTYENCPRAKIFRQRQVAANDLASMQKLVRYNDWTHDPLSLGCPSNQLAARLDLANPNASLPFPCSPRAFGAINGKITAASMVDSMSASIVAGPTHDSVPVFEWTDAVSEKFASTKHVGQPTSFDFDWFTVSPDD